MNAIELKKLTKQFAPDIGCFDINITINQGEVYGFIGPNGAGKTTVIKQMVGFIRSDQGHVKIFNHDVWSQTKIIMKDLGYISGEVAIPEYMTGISYLKTIAKIRDNVTWEYIEKLINYFEFDPKVKVKKMSKGTKQKLALVAAFMHKPKVLILDEPTSGLDPLMQEKFIRLIKELQGTGTTIFISSHIFGEIDSICDRVAFIKKGKIISEVSIKEMRTKTKKIYQVQFDAFRDYQKVLQQNWKILTKDDKFKNIKIEIEEKNVKFLFKEFAAFDIISIKEVPFSLEQYFLKYYQDEVNIND